MARNSYKMNFKDKTIVYSNVDNGDVPCRVLTDDELETMQLLFFSMDNISFSCNEEEFYNNTLTPKFLKWLREHKANGFINTR